MRGRTGMLGALLALQLAIIAGVVLLEPGSGAAEEGPWLDFAAEAVDEVRITGEDQAGVILTRGDDGWQLAGGYPADDARVNGILNKLAGLRATWPVATSAEAARRFQVTQGSHQRRLLLRAGDETVADLFLGTSPGYQQVHARRADGGPIYSVALSNFEVPPAPGEWLDPTLLQPRGAISAVSRPDGWSLTRGEEGWLIDGDAADQEAAEQLVERIRGLRVTGLAQAPQGDVEPAGVVQVEDGAGRYRLTLYGEGDGDSFTAVSDRRDGAFQLAPHQAEALLSAVGAVSRPRSD